MSLTYLRSLAHRLRARLAPLRPSAKQVETVLLDAAFVAGLALVAYGVARILLPAGLIVGGVLLLASVVLYLHSR